MEKLYAQLGRYMVQGEILGLIVIPNQGKIGEVKKAIAEALNKPTPTEGTGSTAEVK